MCSAYGRRAQLRRLIAWRQRLGPGIHLKAYENGEHHSLSSPSNVLGHTSTTEAPAARFRTAEYLLAALHRRRLPPSGCGRESSLTLRRGKTIRKSSASSRD